MVVVQRADRRNSVVIYDVVRRRCVRTIPAKQTPHKLATYKRGIAWSDFMSRSLEFWHFTSGDKCDHKPDQPTGAAPEKIPGKPSWTT